MTAIATTEYLGGKILLTNPVLSGFFLSLLCQDYVWDAKYLTEGPPPNDRGCRSCGKIGHFVRDCPRKVSREGMMRMGLREKKCVTCR